MYNLRFIHRNVLFTSFDDEDRVVKALPCVLTQNHEKPLDESMLSARTILTQGVSTEIHTSLKTCMGSAGRRELHKAARLVHALLIYDPDSEEAMRFADKSVQLLPAGAGEAVFGIFDDACVGGGDGQSHSGEKLRAKVDGGELSRESAAKFVVACNVAREAVLMPTGMVKAFADDMDAEKKSAIDATLWLSAKTKKNGQCAQSEDASRKKGRRRKRGGEAELPPSAFRAAFGLAGPWSTERLAYMLKMAVQLPKSDGVGVRPVFQRANRRYVHQKPRQPTSDCNGLFATTATITEAEAKEAKERGEECGAGVPEEEALLLNAGFLRRDGKTVEAVMARAWLEYSVRQFVVDNGEKCVRRDGGCSQPFFCKLDAEEMNALHAAHPSE
jgi:hypothetical protein